MVDTTRFPVIYTFEEAEYERGLGRAATVVLGRDWGDWWPAHISGNEPLGFLNHHVRFGSLDTLIRWTEERHGSTPLLCMVEHITIPRCMHIDSQFFIDHARPFDDHAVAQMLYEARAPSSSDITMSCKNATWAVLCGTVDHGKAKDPPQAHQYPDVARRQHKFSFDGSHLACTKLSICRVQEGLCPLKLSVSPYRKSQLTMTSRRRSN